MKPQLTLSTVMAPWPKEFATLRSDTTRDTIQKGQFELIHMPGKEIPADKLTKLGNISEHAQFRSQILGLSLLPSDTNN
jgi:hypothetical protein